MSNHDGRNAPCSACDREGCPACHGSGERPAVPAATIHGPVFDPVPPGHLSWVDAYARVCEERDGLRAFVELDAADVAFAIHGSDGKIYYNVLCSDTFGYACADGEGLTLESAPAVLAIHRAEGWAGVAKWVQAQRGGPEKSPFICEVQERIEEHDALRAEVERMRARSVEAEAFRAAAVPVLESISEQVTPYSSTYVREVLSLPGAKPAKEATR